MDRKRIEEALSEATDTTEVVIGAGVLDSVAELFQRTFGHAPAVVVADANTLAVAGHAANERLRGAGLDVRDPFVFPGRPALYADYDNIKPLAAALAGHDAIPVAVGSGTINDIAKRASHECERRYMTVATAASMDGYTAFGASISEQGYKHTMECEAPRALLADLELLTRAPTRMTASGYGDLLAKITAGADWILADGLEVEAIEPKVWSLVQEPLREATGQPAALHAGDQQAMDALIEGLVMSGLAMQAAASSRPASGAEHQFSHLWEMEGLGREDEPPLSHGFKVGLGTVSIAALYERLLARDLTQLDVDAACSRWPAWEEVERQVRAAHDFPPLADAAVRETQAKYLDREQLRRRLTLLRDRWPRLRERASGQLLSADRVREQLRQAGCPTTPGEIGVSEERLRSTYSRAQTIRRRYTVLDLLNEAGLMDECVGELFAPGGFWSR